MNKKINALDKLCMEVSLNGYIYWRDAIEYCKKNNYFISKTVRLGHIYEIVSKKHGVTEMAVERSMRYSKNKIINLKQKMKVDYNVNNANFLAWLIKEETKR